jgi:septum site-determining protein MinD
MSAHVITVTSGKGGVGKTTVTANLAVALAMSGKRVVAIDCDIGLRNLDIVLGLENRIVYDLVDIVEGRARLKQAMIKDKRLPNLHLIPAAQTRDKSAVGPKDMVTLCEQLSDEMDYVLLDCPAGIEGGFRNALAPADQVVIVVNPEVSSVRDADRIIGLIEAEEKGPGSLVINRVKPEMVERGGRAGHPGDRAGRHRAGGRGHRRLDEPREPRRHGEGQRLAGRPGLSQHRAAPPGRGRAVPGPHAQARADGTPPQLGRPEGRLGVHV